MTERNLRNICDEPDDPNMLLYCDDWPNDIPFRPTLKMAGTYPLVWGISVSAAFQSSAGRPLGLTTTTGNKISGPGYGDTGSPVGTQLPDHQDHDAIRPTVRRRARPASWSRRR